MGGSFVLIEGIYQLLQHLNQFAANQFAVVTAVCIVVIVAYAVWNSRGQRKENTKAATRAQHVAE